MAITNMTWRDVEDIVAARVYRQYAKLADDDGRRAFCRDIRRANEHLSGLSQRNVDYNTPRVGEAYALSYHLLRADNIYTALCHLHRAYPLSPDMRVLDIGSGTGSGTMAVAFWVARTFGAVPADLEVLCVEPAQPMRDTASYLLDTFIRRLRQSVRPPLRLQLRRWIEALLRRRQSTVGAAVDATRAAFPIRARHWENVATLEDCARARTDERFDLILFCHTFSLLAQRQWQETIEHVLGVSQLLRPGGALLFLTPAKPAPKQLFMEQVSTSLVRDCGLRQLHIAPGCGYQPCRTSHAPDKYQKRVIEVRRKIDEECCRLGVAAAFADDSGWAPYYGFYCTIETFTRGTDGSTSYAAKVLNHRDTETQRS